MVQISAAVLDERLEKHKEKLEKHVGELATATERVIATHRKAIVEKQMILERLSNMAIDLFATACTMSRTQRVIETTPGDVGLGARALAMCELFCVEAGLRFRANRLALESESVDEHRRVVAGHVREQHGYSIPDAVIAPDFVPPADKPAPASRRPSTGRAKNR